VCALRGYSVFLYELLDGCTRSQRSRYSEYATAWAVWGSDPGRKKRFLGAFAKLRKAAISFVMSVCPSAWNNAPPTGRIFMKFGVCAFFRKSVEKIQNLTRITLGYFT
jgi:hypothetical protein